jgi:hypothetical protein
VQRVLDADIEPSQAVKNASADRREIARSAANESRRSGQVRATADRWLEGMLQWASGKQLPADELWGVLYPMTGKRGRPRTPKAIRLWVVWHVRILTGRGFAAADALSVLEARYGDTVHLSDLNRAQAEFDDLVSRIDAQGEWQLHERLALPRSAYVPQADDARRKKRQRAQGDMLKRLAWLSGNKKPELAELLDTAFGDEKMRALAAQQKPKRPRGRPPKPATDTPANDVQVPVSLMPHDDRLEQLDPSEQEILEAVVRYWIIRV